MSITAIGRYFVGDPNIVSVVTDDVLATITTAGYLTGAAIKADIEALNNGEFEWADTDIVLISYAPDFIVNWFKYDATNATFVANPAAGGLSNSLLDGRIFVGNASNIATGVAMSGDATISNTGVLAIASGVIVNADINAAAAIAFSKLAALSSANILVGSAGNVATSVAMSGDVAISNAGVTTIQDSAVTLLKLDSGISPSHVIKFGGQRTSVGGNATEAFTVTGAVAATDLAFVQIVNNGTGNVTALQAVVTNNTLTVTFSADPQNDTVFNYQLIRAASSPA
jgi:trimeric autotransporter adhesin